MGVGVGGDYPLSAVLSSEFAATRMRGRIMNAVFAFQGFGNFSMFVLSIYGVLVLMPPHSRCSRRLDRRGCVQRQAAQRNDHGSCSCGLHVAPPHWYALDAILPFTEFINFFTGLGAVPAVIALYFRLTIPETPRFTMDVERNVQQATIDVNNILTQGNSEVNYDAVIQRVRAPVASRKDFAAYFSKPENFKVLFGCAYSWFALDVSRSILAWSVIVLLNKMFGIDCLLRPRA
jgi:MFS transporter, PHS family, inorganic phosphate transporter